MALKLELPTNRYCGPGPRDSIRHCRVVAGRVLAVDTAVALQCARLHVPNQRSERDALIAATALVHGMTVATRDTSDFEGTGVALLNPWTKQA